MRDLGGGVWLAGWREGRAGGLWVWAVGGLGGRGRGGRGSLGSGATRPWLLPWPPRGLPPPAGRKREGPTITFNWTFWLFLV